MGEYFSIVRDKVIVKAGGFFCQGCLVGRPKDDQSKDSRYCFACYEALEEEDKVTGPKDYWTSGGFIFVHYGEKYGVAKSGGTVYLGPTATEETPSGVAVSQQGQVEVVTKIVEGGIIPDDAKTGIMLQEKGRGRPPKPENEPVTRMTKWRRKRELQGSLL